MPVKVTAFLFYEFVVYLPLAECIHSLIPMKETSVWMVFFRCLFCWNIDVPCLYKFCDWFILPM